MLSDTQVSAYEENISIALLFLASTHGKRLASALFITFLLFACGVQDLETPMVTALGSAEDYCFLHLATVGQFADCPPGDEECAETVAWSIEFSPGEPTVEDFYKSADILGRLSGFEAHYIDQYVGQLPAEETYRDVQLWKSWCDSNAAALYWDDDLSALRRRGDDLFFVPVPAGSVLTGRDGESEQ
jgi:hypothetical protein